jgi:hypothetical protein
MCQLFEWQLGARRNDTHETLEGVRKGRGEGVNIEPPTPANTAYNAEK